MLRDETIKIILVFTWLVSIFVLLLYADLFITHRNLNKKYLHLKIIQTKTVEACGEAWLKEPLTEKELEAME
jgi:hypothetical protein